jgi:hypothetical protein
VARVSTDTPIFRNVINGPALASRQAFDRRRYDGKELRMTDDEVKDVLADFATTSQGFRRSRRRLEHLSAVLRLAQFEPDDEALERIERLLQELTDAAKSERRARLADRASLQWELDALREEIRALRD